MENNKENQVRRPEIGSFYCSCLRASHIFVSYVPHVFTCLRFLWALLAHVSYVPACLSDFDSYVPSFFHVPYVPSFLRVLRAFIFWRSYVLFLFYMHYVSSSFYVHPVLSFFLRPLHAFSFLRVFYVFLLQVFPVFDVPYVPSHFL